MHKKNNGLFNSFLSPQFTSLEESSSSCNLLWATEMITTTKLRREFCSVGFDALEEEGRRFSSGLVWGGGDERGRRVVLCELLFRLLSI